MRGFTVLKSWSFVVLHSRVLESFDGIISRITMSLGSASTL